MRDKERLLDPSEPLRFIFSHSALREGWDNPNVFQICTLAETSSELKKRQEIGRGLRLAVNDKGERVYDSNINRLTIIANESYEDFAKALQIEMEEQGIDERPKVAIARADISITEKGVTGTEVGRRTQIVDARYLMPDFVAQIQAKTSLAKSTVAAVLLKSGRLKDAVNNPQAYIEGVATAINDAKRALLVEGVEYVKVDGLTYEMHRFEADDLMELFEANVMAVQKQEKTLFSHIVIDSGSGPERAFAKACEDNDDVHFYIKLPRWFVIETPVGPYNPDWALIYKNDNTLYFVAETKDTGSKHGVNVSLLRPLEQLKIECGKRHFKQFEEVHFRVVKSLAELIA
jgi:type III restriction enzyme